jgi:hypothetical protein
MKCRFVGSKYMHFMTANRDLAQFIEQRIFLRCDQLLVPWPRDIEPELA